MEESTKLLREEISKLKTLLKAEESGRKMWQEAAKKKDIDLKNMRDEYLQ
jgi:hypothetical protein